MRCVSSCNNFAVQHIARTTQIGIQKMSGWKAVFVIFMWTSLASIWEICEIISGMLLRIRKLFKDFQSYFFLNVAQIKPC